jgi:hypothetical protein
MTNAEYIQKAIESLKKENKLEVSKLERPHIHDAKVVYFKIQPDSYTMLVLDSQTGEMLDTVFGPNPFLKQGIEVSCPGSNFKPSVAKPVKMTLNNDELITKAQSHLNSFLRHSLFKIGVEPEEFTKSTKLETSAVIIRFACEHRDDAVDLVLNAETGAFISMNHIPQKTAGDKLY